MIGEPVVRLRDKPMRPRHEAQYVALATRVKDRLRIAGYEPVPPGS